MTWLIAETGLWLLAAVAAGLVTFALTAISHKIVRGRANELHAAHKALAEYEKNYDILLDDPATPLSAIELLTRFDRGVMDRRTAYFVAKSIIWKRAAWLEKDDDEPEVLTEMSEVCKHRPDLYETFVKAITYGFMATMLRWFLPARALTLLLVDPRRDPMTPARVVASGAGSTHHNHSVPQAA
jgi:hypothetical protein